MTDDLARVRRAAKRRNTAESEYRDAIRAAANAKIPLRQIGQAAGISHVRVLQITRDR